MNKQSKNTLEFTGERMLLGAVDKELETEHLDRYYFASQLVSGKCVLDVACGTGYGSDILSHSASQVVGVDISNEAIEYCRREYAKESVEFLVGSVTDLPVNDASFDAVVSFETLEHIDGPSQEQFMQEIQRVLKPEGFLIISTPNRDIYDRRGENEFHVKELNYDEFRTMLQEKFRNVVFFSQKWEVCDTIIGEEAQKAVTRNGLPLHKAEYLIAVCSNTKINMPVSQFSVCEDNRLSSIMEWAIENDHRNEINNKHLKELDDSIAEYQSEVQTQRNLIENQETQLKKKEGHIELLLQNERDLNNRVNEQAGELKKKEGHIELLLQNERDLNNRVNEQAGELKKKEGHIELLLQNERDLNNRVNEQAGELKKKEGHIEFLLQNERELNNKVNEQSDQLREKEGQLRLLRQSEQTLHVKVSEQEKTIEQGNVEAEKQKEIIAGQAAALQKQSEAASQQSVSIAKQQEDLHEAHSQLEETRRQLGTVESRLADAESQLNETREALNASRQQTDQLQQSAQELNRIYSSHSWRFMAFFWMLRDLILPKNSRRRLAVKVFVKFLRHPFRFLSNCSVRNIKAFFRTVHENGADAAAEKMNARLSAVKVERAPADPEFVPPEHISVPQFAEPEVSIVIPVYNQLEFTYNCIKSIVENSGEKSYEIILADDHSTDLTRNIRKFISGLVISRNRKNLRFLLNCNKAAKLAKGRYILFLNNDTRVQPDWLRPLVALIESRNDIGMVGSKLVYPDGRLQEAGGILWQDGSAWNYGHGSDPAMPEFNYIKEVDYISGASIMIRRDLWEEIGGFDEQFAPAYCEDSDLAFEVRRHGYKVMYQPQSVVIHFEGISNGTDTSSGQKSYQIINQQKFFEKWKDTLASHYPNGVNPFVARERGYGKKYLLMVDHYVPMFDKDAGSKTVFQYLKLFVNEGYQVKFIGDNFFQHEPYTTVLEQMGIEVLFGSYYANHWKEWLKENGHNIRYVFLNRPHIAVNYIDEVREYTDARIVYYGHDLHFLRERREYLVTGNAEKLQTSLNWQAREFELMRKSDMAYYPSEVEAEEIRKIDSNIKVKAIPAYLFSDVHDPDYTFAKRNNVMFIGGFGHGPNVDAVIWLASEVMPHLLKLLPNITVYILGSNPPAEIQALDSEHLRIVGFVTEEQLAHYYQSCRLSVVPLRYGAGIKGKVIESLRYGLPVVTTSVGAEGITESENVLTIADEPEEFAKVTAKLYQSEEKLARISRDSCEYIREHFSPENAKKVIGPEFDME